VGDYAYSENRKQDTSTRVLKHKHFKFIMVYVVGIEVYVVGLHYKYTHGQVADYTRGVLANISVQNFSGPV